MTKTDETKDNPPVIESVITNMAASAASGIRFKVFNGDASEFELWEDSFMSNIRLLKLH